MSNIKKRLSAERRFKFYGQVGVFLSLLFVSLLIIKIFSTGSGAFFRTTIETDIFFDPELMNVDQNSSDKEISRASFEKLADGVIDFNFKNLSEDEFIKIREMYTRRFDYHLRDYFLKNKEVINNTVTLEISASSDLDQIVKGNYPRNVPESQRKINDYQLTILDELTSKEKIGSTFNLWFFTNGDSRDPETAGILGAIMGSLYALMICLVFAFPIGLFASVYLEEFTKPGKMTDLIEVNINNLAAVPSIVFGLLGLGMLIGVFNMPFQVPLVGGLTLGFMTLPTIIIACRSSLRAVPPSIRHGALALGATKVQTTFHHVVPLALPGTLTGTIIGMAQALGETAPLLMVGMVAFVMEIPGGPLDPATGLPSQIYLWSESAERGFIEKTSAGIMLLLLFLIVMNLAAILIRRKVEVKW
jgi:phosphate transport system permease protein